MKTNFIIIWALILALLGAFALKAQDTTHSPSSLSMDKTGKIITANYLIADETELIMPLNEGKTEATIVCDNETIFRMIHKTHSQLFKRYTCDVIFTGQHLYKHYVIYIDKGDADIIKNWAKVHL